MTAPIEFGSKPYKCKIELNKADGDFIATIRTSDASDFPAGAAVTVKIATDPATLWAATVTGPTAAWSIDKAAVALLVPGTKLAAHVLYSDNSGTDLVWFSGEVKWND